MNICLLTGGIIKALPKTGRAENTISQVNSFPRQAASALHRLTAPAVFGMVETTLERIAHRLYPCQLFCHSLFCKLYTVTPEPFCEIYPSESLPVKTPGDRLLHIRQHPLSFFALRNRAITRQSDSALPG